MSDAREALAEATRRRLQRIDEIPTLPAVLLRIWDLTAQAETSATDLARALGEDPGLTGTVLRLANSAYFGFPRKVSTVKQAVVVLGFETVRNLATGASVFRALRGRQGGIDADEFLRHGVATAMAARTLIADRAPHKAGVAFCAGALHDVGKLVAAEFLTDGWRAVEASRAAGTEDSEAERDAFGLTHAEIGAWFAHRWCFPEDLAAAVRWHHDPEAAEEHADCVAAVHLGDVVAHRCGAVGAGCLREPVPSGAALSRLGVEEGRLVELADEIRNLVTDGQAVRLNLGV